MILQQITASSFLIYPLNNVTTATYTVSPEKTLWNIPLLKIFSFYRQQNWRDRYWHQIWWTNRSRLPVTSLRCFPQGCPYRQYRRLSSYWQHLSAKHARIHQWLYWRINVQNFYWTEPFQGCTSLRHFSE